MKRVPKKKKLIAGVIVNNALKQSGKDYRIINRKSGELLSQQGYKTIRDAKTDAKLMGIKLYKTW